eukprot:1878623-Pyramimonas_sp.AAC.1
MNAKESDRRRTALAPDRTGQRLGQLEPGILLVWMFFVNAVSGSTRNFSKEFRILLTGGESLS